MFCGFNSRACINRGGGGGGECGYLCIFDVPLCHETFGVPILRPYIFLFVGWLSIQTKIIDSRGSTLVQIFFFTTTLDMSQKRSGDIYLKNGIPTMLGNKMYHVPSFNNEWRLWICHYHLLSVTNRDSIVAWSGCTLLAYYINATQHRNLYHIDVFVAILWSLLW